MNDIINIVSFGITNLSDIDLLDKQYDLCTKYCKNKINFIAIPGREHGKSNINNITELQKHINKKYDFFIPDSLLPNNAAEYNPSIIPALTLNDFFYKSAPGKYFTIHLDCLPLKEFNFNNWIIDKPMFIIEQSRGHITYAWENIFYIDTNIIPSNEINFDCGIFEGERCDTGGGTHKIVQKYQHNKCWHTMKYLNSVDTILNCNITNKNKEILLKNYFLQYETLEKFKDPHWSEIYLDDVFFHYRSFSGWHRKDIYTENVKEKRKQLILDL
jgi:hypothetical protein